MFQDVSLVLHADDARMILIRGDSVILSEFMRCIARDIELIVLFQFCAIKHRRFRSVEFVTRIGFNPSPVFACTGIQCKTCNTSCGRKISLIKFSRPTPMLGFKGVIFELLTVVIRMAHISWKAINLPEILCLATIHIEPCGLVDFCLLFSEIAA